MIKLTPQEKEEWARAMHAETVSAAEFDELSEGVRDRLHRQVEALHLRFVERESKLREGHAAAGAGSIVRGENTAMKYFYRSKVSAVWMATEFGMRFTGDGIDLVLGSHGVLCSIPEKYLVDSDSLHLLEPQEDDLLCIGDDDLYWVSDYDMTGFREEVKRQFITSRAAKCFIEDRQGKIIRRDNKAFHWPECGE